VLGIVQLLMALFGFIAVGAIGGAYWSMNYYERQLAVIRADAGREVDYISRMLEALLMQVTASSRQMDTNSKRIQEAREEAAAALRRAKEAGRRLQEPAQLPPPLPPILEPAPATPAAGENNPGDTR
jgi:hypothetical protein